MRSLWRKWSALYGKHMIAIAVMVIVALGIGGYILSNQRLYLPAWVPVIGTDFYTVNGEFRTAQAVMPGQGQTVNIAGVPVGEIGSVSLEDGRAIVEMKIRRARSPIYNDATLWIRPKTPLNDMYIDMNPGTKAAGKIPENGMVPLSQTKSNVNFDEFLSVMDADTRSYLQSLFVNAGEGLEGRGDELRSGFKRFAPTGKYGVRIVKELQKRRHNIKRAIHNLALLSKQLGDDSDKFAALIDSSSVTLRVWASEQESIKQIIAKAPASLGEMADVSKIAEQVVEDSAVAFKDFEPLAKNFGTSMKAMRPFFKDQTKVTRDSFRPAARESQPLLDLIAPASSGLKKAMPDATAATRSFNHLLATIAYNPPGQEEGYLYWLTWFNHLNSTTFNRADASGPIASGGVLGTGCDFSAAGLLARGGNPALQLVLALSGLPTTGKC